MRERPCPVHGCKTWIGEDLLCHAHWRALPDSIISYLRRALDQGRDSSAYRNACATAVRWLNRRMTIKRRERRERREQRNRREAVRS